MKTGRRISYQQFQRETAAARAKNAPLIAAFGEIRRDKPREADEARVLRSLGTPERLVGPIRGTP